MVGEALPGGLLMRLCATHAGDDGVMLVIPLAGLTAGQATHSRVGTIGGDHQRRAQGAAISQGQQPIVSRTAHLLQACVGQHLDTGVLQALQQRVLHHTVFNDMAQHVSVHTGRRKVDVPGAAAVPHVHVRVRAGAPCANTLPGAEALQDALAGGRQGADPGFKGVLSGEGFDAERAAVEQHHVQPAVFERQRQSASDHSGPDNQHICAHFHALSLSR